MTGSPHEPPPVQPIGTVGDQAPPLIVGNALQLPPQAPPPCLCILVERNKMNANIEMNIGNNNANANNNRREAAIATLRQRMSAIPNSDEVTNIMILDWVNNIGAEDLQGMTYEHLRELIEGIYQDMAQNPPGFTDDHYKQMFNIFTDFVHEFHNENIQGGKRRRRRGGGRKRRQTKRKSRRSKKTRRHK